MDALKTVGLVGEGAESRFWSGSGRLSSADWLCWCGRSYQADHPDKVVGGRDQIAGQLGLVQPEIARPSESADRLHPTKIFSSARVFIARSVISVSGAARHSPAPTCPIARHLTDANYQPVRVRDLHLYAAYSRSPVGCTGSPPRVSMPPQLPAQIALIRSQPRPLPPPVGAPLRKGAP